MFRSNANDNNNKTGRTRGRFLGRNRASGKRISWKPKEENKENPPSPPRTKRTTSRSSPLRLPNPSLPSSPSSSSWTPLITDLQHGFSRQEIEDFQEAFRLFDVDEAGTLVVGSFRRILKSLQEDPAQHYPHLDKILEQLAGLSDDESLDFDAFVGLMASSSLQQRLQSEKGGRSNFQHVFDLFDVDRKGYITIGDLERVAVELGEYDMTREELEEMIDRAHSRRDGRVTLPEFTKMMTLNLFQKMEEHNSYAKGVIGTHHADAN